MAHVKKNVYIDELVYFWSRKIEPCQDKPKKPEDPLRLYAKLFDLLP